MHDFRDDKARRREMIERFSIFLVGVAIGCVMLGFYFNGKRKAVQRQQQQQQQVQQEAP